MRPKFQTICSDVRMDVLCGEVDPQYSRLPNGGSGMNVERQCMDMAPHTPQGLEGINVAKNALKVLHCSSFAASVYQVDGAQCMSHGFQ